MPTNKNKKYLATGAIILGAALLFKIVLYPKLKDLFTKDTPPATLPAASTAGTYTAPATTTTTTPTTTGGTYTPPAAHAQTFQAKDAEIGETLYSGSINGTDTYETFGDYDSKYRTYDYGDYLGEVVSKTANWVKVYHEAQTWLFGASGYLYIEGIAIVSTDENL